MTTDTVESLAVPTKPTLFHCKHFSSSRPLFVLLELGLVPLDFADKKEGESATKKQKTDGSPDIQVELVTWDQLKKDPILTQLNPQARLPFWYDPTTSPPLCLNESGGLVQYLLETYDTQQTLSPTVGDPRRAEFLKLLHFGPASGYHITVHLLFPGTDLEEKKKQWHAVVVATLEQALAQWKGPYLLGADFSAADASLAYELVTAEAAACHDELFQAHPALQAYHKVLKGRPAYQAVFPTEESKEEVKHGDEQ